MKKLISLAIALTMLLSALAVLAIPASAAGEGDWAVIYPGNEMGADFSGDHSSIAGYEYTKEGFKTIPTSAWETKAPELSIQLKNKVDLKKGVYMEVRVDEFSYSGDKWFNIHLWDSVGIMPGQKGYGEGVQTLIRPDNSPDANDITKPGAVTTVDWYYSEFTRGNSKAVSMKDAQNKTEDDGRPILVLTVTWDDTGKTFAVNINGADAPKAVIDYMNSKWGDGKDGMAYVGFNTHHGVSGASLGGGRASCTIMKFGTSKDTATVPEGTDKVEPVNNEVKIAEIADPSTVKANMPAVFLTGDSKTSDSKGKPEASNGGSSTTDENGVIHATGESASYTAVNFVVKETVSYDIKDFPYVVVMIKNYCDCGDPEGHCYAKEVCRYYVPTGNILTAGAECVVDKVPINDTGYKGANGEIYRFYGIDISKKMSHTAEGRINSLRIDTLNSVMGTDGKKNVDVIFAAFFRNEAEAKAYIENYATLSQLAAYTPPVKEPSVQTGGASTPPPRRTTATTAATTTVAATTAAPVEQESGCGSTIASCAIVVTTVLGLGIGFTRKRKRK